MNNLEFRVPKNEDEFNEYDLFRWRLLRKPIGKTIESLKGQKTIFMISHKINSLRYCNKILKIEDNNISEQSN